MSPAPRAVLAVVAVAVAAGFLPAVGVVVVLLACAGAFAVDAAAARATPAVHRELPVIAPRGVAVPVAVRVTLAAGEQVVVRQPMPPDLALDVDEARGPVLDATLTALRRGRHTVAPPVVRRTGPLGLARWDHSVGEPSTVTVYPDVVAARRIATAVRTSRTTDGRLRRGPLGLGTEFETVREYSPDDDIRQLNWRTTARLGRPMSNQYRLDQDREIVCLVDCGRLMAGPVGGDRTRLDAALDAVTAVAYVADELGDRCGAVAFDDQVRRVVQPRRAGGRAVVDALFDLEPSNVDSDPEAAFRRVGGGKRSLVLVLTDLLEEAAARPLLAAVPVLARRHAVVVASVADPDVDGVLRDDPSSPFEVYAAAAATTAVVARDAVVARIEAAGARTIVARPGRLAEACVDAYLTLKRSSRL